MPTTKPKIYTICVLILLSGLALSFGLFFSLNNSHDLKRDKILSNLYNNVHNNIQHEIDRNLNSLYALSAAYQAYHGWNRSEFGSYASYYTAHIHSIQALEWVPIVPIKQRDLFEQSTKNQGYKDFQIFTKTSDGQIVRAEDRPYYYPVYFIEPFESNKAAFGFDPGYSNQSRQLTIDKAIETKRASSTSVTTIIQKKNPHKAILVFVPIYDDEVVGLIEGVYLIDKLVEVALEDLNLPTEINLVISNNKTTNQGLLGSRSPHSTSSNTREDTLQFADQSWVLRMEYIGDVVGHVISPFWLLIASLLFTALIVKVVYDVLTDNRKRLHRHLKELKAKKQDLEQYTYAASHDLQEPLHTIQSLVSLIHQDYYPSLDSKGKTCLDHIKSASERMSELITNLLRYSQIGSTEHKTWTDCRTVIESVIEDLESEIGKKGASIAINSSMPVIKAYPDSLKLLFHNLITNSIKFQAVNNQPKVEISALELKDKSWQFAVRDNGIGFLEAYNERIFTIFRTLHSRSIYPGTGFGLANCKKIVELHNGHIWVNSKPSIGSTFFFTLKLT